MEREDHLELGVLFAQAAVMGGHIEIHDRDEVVRGAHAIVELAGPWHVAPADDLTRRGCDQRKGVDVREAQNGAATWHGAADRRHRTG